MIKVSKFFPLFCLICLVAAAPALQAQNDQDVTRAADEAIRRQADTITLRSTLVEAQEARKRGQILEAHKLYERCYDLVGRIGSGIDQERAATIAGLTEVLFTMAHQYQEEHHYLEAGEQLNRILVVDPQNQMAAKAKFENDKMYEAQKGTMPSQVELQKIPTLRSNEVRVATLVQDGKFLYEAGQLDEAEEKLEQAHHEEPSNVAAYNYLQMIKQRRIADAERKTELLSDGSLLHVQKSWITDRSNGELTPHPNQWGRTNLAYTAKGRQTIMSKLDRIKLDSVKYDDLPLTEVINNLSDNARQRDPDKQGINFFIDRTAPAAAAGGAGAIDPATGLPVAAPLPTDTGDISAVTIKITPGLTEVRLADVLDAITKTASKPIRYSILDYAVVFSLRGAEPVPLEIRTFHVDPNTFRMGLESVSGLEFGNVSGSSSGGSGGGGGGGGSSGGQGGQTGAIVPYVLVPSGGVSGGSSGGGGGGGGGGSIGGGGGQGGQGGGLLYVTGTSNTTANLQVLVRNFFAAAGVDLNTNNPANIGKAVFWNDRKGVLLVRSTAQDLDMIESAIQVLNQAPPEVNIKAKFIEITQNDSKALGFNWFLGNTRIGGTSVLSGGTQPSLSAPSTPANQEGIFPGSVAGGTAIGPASTDGNLTPVTALRDSAPTLATFTGILTDPQFRVAIQALEQRDGVDELNAPEVTTESGRQAQIQAIDIQTIVTGTTVSTSGGSTVSGVANGVNSPIVQQVPTVNYPTSPLPFGPTLDVIPYVSSDEFSVQMTLIPTITEFIGYDDPGQFVPAALVSGQTGNASLQAVLPLPHFRARQVTTSVSVWDAQTVVLGGLMVDTVTRVKDKIPMLGDLPLVGRLFQSQSSTKSKKNLMIFVTPTIINPDGTRYHSDDEMPFLQNATPVTKPLGSQ